jgi:predicted transcriptional regulator
MKGIVYDTSKTGFHAVLTDWQIKVMQVVWNSKEGIISRIAYEKVNEVLKGETISRASVINFLEDMREMGVLKGEEKTGKGGHHWVYFPALDEAGFKRFIVEKMIATLMESFPEETREVIKSRINYGI